MNIKTDKQQLLQSYLHAISILLLNEVHLIQHDILERMVNFALTHHEGSFVEQWQLSKALSIMKDKELKYRFVRRHVLGSTEGEKELFAVYDEESAELAEKILSEFSHDEKLTEKIKSKLENWKLENAKKVKSEGPHWSESVLA